MARKKNMSEAEDDGGMDDFDYGEEPNFDDPDDFVDDITDEELMPEIMRAKPKESDGVDSVIVIDNVPEVEGARVDKLKNVVRKIYSKFGKLMNEHYPLDDEGKTKGYIFLEFNNHANALEAVKQTNNYKLDKQHTFQVQRRVRAE
jgi:translation initiation factor 3 subunit B